MMTSMMPFLRLVFQLFEVVGEEYNTYLLTNLNTNYGCS